MKRILANWPTLAIAVLAGAACWQLMPPQPRWTIAPLVGESPWDKVFFSHDSAWIVTYQQASPSTRLRQVRLWDAVTGELLSVVHDGLGQLESLAIAPDKRQLAVWWHDRHIDVWDLVDGRIAAKHRHRAAEHWYTHVQIVYRPDGRLLLYGPEITSGKLWDAATAELVTDLAIAERDCDSWTTNFPGFIVGSSPTAIYAWSLAGGKLVAEVPEGGNVIAARITAGGSAAVAYRPHDFAEQQPRLCCYDGDSGETHTLPWRDVAWLPIDISSDGRIMMVQVRDERPIMTWLLHRFAKARKGPSWWKVEFVEISTGTVAASVANAERARFAPDGQRVAVSHGDGTIGIYDWPLRPPWGWIVGAAAAAGCGWQLLTAAARRWRARRSAQKNPPLT